MLDRSESEFLLVSKGSPTGPRHSYPVTQIRLLWYGRAQWACIPDARSLSQLCSGMSRASAKQKWLQFPVVFEREQVSTLVSRQAANLTDDTHRGRTHAYIQLVLCPKPT